VVVRIALECGKEAAGAERTSPSAGSW